jgi:hypothetical protein
MDRKRLLRYAFIAVALAAAWLLAPAWPKEQTVHYLLGDAAPRVEEVDARWAEDRDRGHGHGHGHETENWFREATFRYAPGGAPRVVTHEPRMPDGDYTVELEIVASNAKNVVTRHVRLQGGVTTIDLAPSVPR